MPPDAITWLVGTLAVAAMTGCSGVCIAFIRRSPNGAATKGDIESLRSAFAELRSEQQRATDNLRQDVARLGDKLDGHLQQHR